MSRDWTPRQMYYADKEMKADNGYGFLDMSVTWHDSKGNEYPMFSDEELDFCKQYPVFGLTFEPLWKWYDSQDDKRRAKIVIEMVEKKLAAYISGNSEKTDKLTTVQKWFEGKLDPAFYYNADNNNAMYEHLTGMYYAISTAYIYLVVGRSGSGKTTVTNILHELFALNTVESFTTRPPRYENEPGHTFVSKEDFDKIPMVAYTMFNGYEYGVPEEMVDKAQLYVIDIPGVKTLQERYVGKPIKTVYIDCDKETLRKRMLERGDSEEAVTKRMANDDVMFAEENTFPFDVRVDGARTAAEVAADIAAFIVQTEGNSVI